MQGRGSRSTCLLVALASVVMVAAGCGSIRPHRTTKSLAPQAGAGDPEAPPSLAVLPEMARGPAAASEHVLQGFSMAMQVFRETLPVPPVDRSNVKLQSWVEKVVTPWIEKRRDGVDETRFLFGVEPAVSPSEAVVAHAVLGLLHEDTALELAHIPPPAELDKEPEIADMYRHLIHNQSQPFAASALKEFQLCAKTSDDEGKELRRWAEFCSARSRHLRVTYAMK